MRSTPAPASGEEDRFRLRLLSAIVVSTLRIGGERWNEGPQELSLQISPIACSNSSGPRSPISAPLLRQRSITIADFQVKAPAVCGGSTCRRWRRKSIKALSFAGTLAAIGVIQRQAGECRAPIGEDAHQAPVVEKAVDIAVDHIGDADPVECRLRQRGGIVEDQPAVDGKFDPLAVLLEFPALDLTTGGMAEADTIMVEQIVRMFWHAVAPEIAWRGNDMG